MRPNDQLESVERRLGLREEQLRQEIAAVRQRAEDPAPGDVGDAKDAAASEAQDVVADAEVERDLAELHEIRLARRRIADGTYGSCLDCGKEIDRRRLLAQPQTPRCLECQVAAERAAPGTTAGGPPARRA